MADILVFGAHPDDAEFGMGGSILKFVKEGKRVALCVLTRGGAGSHGTADERENELKNAAQKLGVELEMLDFEDSKVFDNYESRLKIARVIRKHTPNTIFTPYHTNHAFHRDGIAHPDHTATGQLVKIAARYAKFRQMKDLEGEPWAADHIVYYMIPKDTQPNLVNDISDYFEEWVDVAKSHESQMALRDGAILKILSMFRERHGLLIGVKYGEGFIVEEPIKMDINHFMK